MAMRRTTMGMVLALAVMGTVVAALGALVATRTFTNTGSIIAVGVGVYSDSSCTTALSTIDWGTLNPGASTTRTAYIRNEGTVPLTLSMATSAWNPTSASTYITLTWNVSSTLPAGSVFQAVLTLSVSSSITGVTSFSFTITITGQ
jgi:hypothetical protein